MGGQVGMIAPDLADDPGAPPVSSTPSVRSLTMLRDGVNTVGVDPRTLSVGLTVEAAAHDDVQSCGLCDLSQHLRLATEANVGAIDQELPPASRKRPGFPGHEFGIVQQTCGAVLAHEVEEDVFVRQRHEALRVDGTRDRHNGYGRCPFRFFLPGGVGASGSRPWATVISLTTSARKRSSSSSIPSPGPVGTTAHPLREGVRSQG